jgi:hypothetical protein
MLRVYISLTKQNLYYYKNPGGRGGGDLIISRLANKLRVELRVEFVNIFYKNNKDMRKRE